MVTQKSNDNKTVLVGVLNWGMGHATRSEALITMLEQAGYRPVIASDGVALRYLQERFPHLPSEVLPAYAVRYFRGWPAWLSIVAQAAKILSAARKERKLTRALVCQYRPCGLISDNRLGFCHPEIPSAYITHQLWLPLPVGRLLVSRWHHRYIKRFRQCWVPDFRGPQSLSGDLAQGLHPGIPTFFAGPLSRLAGRHFDREKIIYKACFLLSGPEPQRSLLEDRICREIAKRPGRYVLLRGRPGGGKRSWPDGLEVIDMANAEQVARAVLRSEVTVARSGYSSLMDFYFLGNRAMLIPTPGQPEQEYLARYHLAAGHFGYVSQGRLNLFSDLKQAATYDGLHRDGRRDADWKTLFGLFEAKGKG